MGIWTDRSRPIIRATLDALPAGADERACRRALREAYPWGERLMYPYKVWCREVKAALSRRFGGRVLDAAPPPPVGYALQRRPGRWWLAVSCGWCAGTPLSSCIMCGSRHARLAEVVNLLLFRQLAADVKDAASGPVLCDLVEEALGERPEMPPPAKKALEVPGLVVFDREEASGEAIVHALAGGVACHLHRRINRRYSPVYLIRDVNRGYPIADLFCQDGPRLRNLAHRLGGRDVRIERENTDTQHIILCGAPLRKLLAAADVDIEQYRLTEGD